MTYSIIQKSQLEGALRLDAEYYQPEYLSYYKRLETIGKVALGKFSFITDGQHGYHKVDPDSEIRHITAKNVTGWIVNDHECDRLALETNDKNKRSVLQENDLLLSTAGTIGCAGIVTKQVLPANIDQDVARIHVLDERRLNPNFLLAFLNSKYGQFQITRETTGQIQTHLSLDKIKEKIFIHIPQRQSEISLIVDQALKERKNSELQCKQAEDLLLKELGLNDFEEKNELFSVVNLLEVQSTNRIDAEYFQVKYKTLIEKIKNFDLQPLAKIIQNVEAKFNPYNFSDKEFDYVELSNINTSLGTIDGANAILGKEAPSRAKRMLKEGDVIVSSIEGSLEKVALVAKEQEGYLASTGFFQFRGKEILPEVLMALAKSKVFQYQLKQRCSGTILTAVPQDSIKNILIPILPRETQQKIADLVQQSHIAHKKSKELLDEAKRKVEEMVDTGYNSK